MFYSIRRTKLVKDYLKGTAKLLYKDVSDDIWDQENLTKQNLDFTLESIKYVDMYSKRLMGTDRGAVLLEKHFDNFVHRIGAYMGEVIKSNMEQGFYWYEFKSVHNYSTKLDEMYSKEMYSLLYSKKNDIAVSPLFVTSQILKGENPYPNFLVYAEEMMKRYPR